MRRALLPSLAASLFALLLLSRAFCGMPAPVSRGELVAALEGAGARVESTERAGDALFRFRVRDARGRPARLEFGATFGDTAPPEWSASNEFAVRRGIPPSRALFAADGRLLRITALHGSRGMAPACRAHGYRVCGRAAYTFPGATLDATLSRGAGRHGPILLFKVEVEGGDDLAASRTRLASVAASLLSPLLRLAEERLDGTLLERGVQPFEEPRAFE